MQKRKLAVFEAAVLTVLYAVKAYFCYDYLSFGKFSPVFASAALLLPLLCWLIAALRHRSPLPALLAVYLVGSFTMTVTRVYFAYFGTFPSMSMIGNVGQLGNVSETIGKLCASGGNILNLLDLPLFILYALNFRPRILAALERKDHDHSENGKGRFRVLLPAVLTAAAVLFAAAMTLLGAFRLSYLKNELAVYYTGDFLKAAFGLGAIDPDSIDTEKYLPASADPEQKKYTGIAQGRNVITVQVEALQAFVIGLNYNGQEVTPNLNALIGSDDTFYFSDYYYQIGGGNTADAEFTANNSIYAPEKEAAYDKYTENDFYSLPILLKDHGYSGAYAFHGYIGTYWNRETAYPYQGFDDYLSGEDFAPAEEAGLGICDAAFFGQSVDYLKKRIDEGNGDPICAFLITLSSHHPYYIPEQFRTLKLLPEHERTLIGYYLQTINYVDQAIGHLIHCLKAAGIYDNCVLSIYGDHYAIPTSDADSYGIMCELLGHEYYEDDIFRVPMLINVPGCGEGAVCDTVGGHVDFLPTLLNLLGIENEKGMMFGYDLLNTPKEDGVVYEQVHMAKGSFISEDYIYCYPASGIAANAKLFDRHTGRRLEEIPEECITVSDEAKAALAAAEAVLDGNRARK